MTAEESKPEQSRQQPDNTGPNEYEQLENLSKLMEYVEDNSSTVSQSDEASQNLGREPEAIATNQENPEEAHILDHHPGEVVTLKDYSQLRRIFPGQEVDLLPFDPHSQLCRELLEKAEHTYMTSTKRTRVHPEPPLEQVSRYYNAEDLRPKEFAGKMTNGRILFLETAPVIERLEKEGLNYDPRLVYNYAFLVDLESTGRGVIGTAGTRHEVYVVDPQSEMRSVETKTGKLSKIYSGKQAYEWLKSASTAIAEAVVAERMSNAFSAGLPGLGKRK